MRQPAPVKYGIKEILGRYGCLLTLGAAVAVGIHFPITRNILVYRV